MKWEDQYRKLQRITWTPIRTAPYSVPVAVEHTDRWMLRRPESPSITVIAVDGVAVDATRERAPYVRLLGLPLSAIFDFARDHGYRMSLE